MKRLISLLLTICFAPMLLGAISCQKAQNPHTRYEITAEYIPENRTLTGVVKVSFENTLDSELSALKFNLYPNAYRKDALFRPVSPVYEDSAYYEGESYGEMVISSVVGAKSWEVMGEDENILYAYLERSLFPGDKVVVDIGFMTKLAAVKHRTGVTKSTVNLGNAFPVLCGVKNGGFYECAYYSDGDPFYTDFADYKVTLTLPKEYEVAATGQTHGERSLESKKVHTMYATNVTDFALVLARDYRLIREKAGDTLLAYYYYADEKPDESLALVKEAFSFYERTFGKYPHAVYTVAETGLCLGGQEYPCLTMLSDSLYGVARARAIVHEIAHLWWGTVVGNDQIENAWQDEGLAEYSALLFFEEYEKYGLTREELVTAALKEYRSYYDVYGSVLGRTDTRMTRHLKEYLSEYEYAAITFDKSVVMWDTLRKSVGEKKFLSSLKRYYGKHAYNIASAGALVGSFERSGLDVAGFFDSFLQGKGVL